MARKMLAHVKINILLQKSYYIPDADIHTYLNHTRAKIKPYYMFVHNVAIT